MLRRSIIIVAIVLVVLALVTTVVIGVAINQRNSLAQNVGNNGPAVTEQQGTEATAVPEVTPTLAPPSPTPASPTPTPELTEDQQAFIDEMENEATPGTPENPIYLPLFLEFAREEDGRLKVFGVNEGEEVAFLPYDPESPMTVVVMLDASNGKLSVAVKDGTFKGEPKKEFAGVALCSNTKCALRALDKNSWSQKGATAMVQVILTEEQYTVFTQAARMRVEEDGTITYGVAICHGHGGGSNPPTDPTDPPPTEPPVTPTPDPTEPPVTPTPDPTEPPVTPTPDPTEPPVTPTPDPTEPPVTPTPDPTEPPVTPTLTPNPTHSNPVVTTPVPADPTATPTAAPITSGGFNFGTPPPAITNNPIHGDTNLGGHSDTNLD